jgi:hypothetical protein
MLMNIIKKTLNKNYNFFKDIFSIINELIQAQ